ncbi:hypothetical protein CSB37_00785 [bacterium DOLZORAL124_38_8]|nr:MAG: hypothetical protein CSB37_00785 [bacterium DOLZORAL124_38_8]
MGLSEAKRKARLAEQKLVNESIQTVQNELLGRVKSVKKVLKSLRKSGDTKAERILTEIQIKESKLNLLEVKKGKKLKNILKEGADYRKSGIARKNLTVGDKIRISKKYEIEITKNKQGETLVDVIEHGRKGTKKVVKRNVPLNEKLLVGNELKVGKTIITIEKLKVEKLGKRTSASKNKSKSGTEKNDTMENPEPKKQEPEVDPEKLAAQKAYNEMSDADFIASNPAIQAELKVTDLEGKLRRHTAVFDEALANQRLEIEEAKMKVEKLEGQLSESNKSIQAKETEIAQLKKDADADKSLIAEKEQLLVDEKATNKKLKAKKDKWKNQFKEVSQNYKTLEGEFNGMKVEFEKVKTQLSERKNQFDEALKSQRDTADKLAQAKEKGHLDLVNRLQSELNEKTSKVTSLEAEIATLRQKEVVAEGKMKAVEINLNLDSMRAGDIDVNRLNTLETQVAEMGQTLKNLEKNGVTKKDLAAFKESLEGVKTKVLDIKTLTATEQIQELKVGESFTKTVKDISYSVTRTESGFSLVRGGKTITIEEQSVFKKVYGVHEAQFTQIVELKTGERFKIQKDGTIVEHVTKSNRVGAEAYKKQTVKKTDSTGNVVEISQEAGVRLQKETAVKTENKKTTTKKQQPIEETANKDSVNSEAKLNRLKESNFVRFLDSSGKSHEVRLLGETKTSGVWRVQEIKGVSRYEVDFNANKIERLARLKKKTRTPEKKPVSKVNPEHLSQARRVVEKMRINDGYSEKLARAVGNFDTVIDELQFRMKSFDQIKQSGNIDAINIEMGRLKEAYKTYQEQFNRMSKLELDFAQNKKEIGEMTDMVANNMKNNDFYEGHGLNNPKMNNLFLELKHLNKRLEYNDFNAVDMQLFVNNSNSLRDVVKNYKSELKKYDRQANDSADFIKRNYKF